jgi:hypothetical protein
MTAEHEPQPVLDSVKQTYAVLRYGMAIAAASLPLLLFALGSLGYGCGLLGSLSEYYHRGTRDLFVGIMCLVGGGLVLYRGYSKLEDRLLNVAGLCAIGVATLPMNRPGPSGGADCRLIDSGFTFQPGHAASATIFFLCLAYVCIFCSEQTLKYIRDTSLRERYRRRYVMLGALMLSAPIGAIAAAMLLGINNIMLLIAEAAGIWVFALFWICKTWEMRDIDQGR